MYKSKLSGKYWKKHFFKDISISNFYYPPLYFVDAPTKSYNP